MKSAREAKAFSKIVTLTLAVGRSHPSRQSFSTSTVSTFAVKRVTRSNFDSSLSDLRCHIRSADFVSIDLEMTGITSAPWRESLEFDRFDIRYLKVKDSAEKFAVVQFGVCPFRWDGEKESFIAHPYNFYIFPRKELPFDWRSYEFLCQTTSIDFLAKYQFDFNTCIHEGISYLSREQEAEALHSLSSAYDDELANFQNYSKEMREIPLVSTFDVLYTERMKNKFHEWRNGLLFNTIKECQLEENCDGSIPSFQTVFFKMRPALRLNGFNSHQLRLIQLVIRKHFKDLAYICAWGEDCSKQKLVVYTDAEDDRAVLMKEVKEDLSKEMEGKVKSAVGFRHVIDLLSSEKKLIVGHNCFLDIAHIHSKFLGSLPSSVREFASTIHNSFPYIIDTKCLLKASPVVRHLMKKNSTSLSSAFATLCPQIAYASNNSDLASRPCIKVEVQVDDMRASSWNSGAKHEAGYDAFMTGCVFAQACSHLGVTSYIHSPSTELAKDEKLQEHLNLLYLSWNNGVLIDLTTGTEPPESSFHNHRRRFPKIVFANVILVWGFPSKFKPRELRECICKVFGPDSVASIYYLDETAAFIHFSKEEFASNFLILMGYLERRNDPASVLHPLSKLFEGGSTHAGNYDAYKKICSSQISRVLFVNQAEAVGIRWKTEVELKNSDNLEVVCSGESMAEYPIPDTRGKDVEDKEGDARNDLGCKLSCEDVLDSLYVIQSSLGKWKRTL